VDSAITDYIKEHHFDHLTAPSQGDDPRAEIARRMMSQRVRTRLRRVGAELLWFDIGHFDVVTTELDEKEIKTIRDVVEAQRVDTWSARWDGEAMVVRAHGEARRLAYQDMGRSEGQAEMLLGIIQALGEASPEDGLDDPTQRLRDLRAIVWTSIAQVLDAAADEQRRRSLPSHGTNRRANQGDSHQEDGRTG
jgi:hypothetical protein